MDLAWEPSWADVGAVWELKVRPTPPQRPSGPSSGGPNNLVEHIVFEKVHEHRPGALRNPSRTVPGPSPCPSRDPLDTLGTPPGSFRNPLGRPKKLINTVFLMSSMTIVRKRPGTPFGDPPPRPLWSLQDPSGIPPRPSRDPPPRPPAWDPSPPRLFPNSREGPQVAYRGRPFCG